MNSVVKHLLISLIINILNAAVTIYTVLTLPFFYLYEKPWRRLKIAGECGGKLTKTGHFSANAPKSLANAEYLEYERNVELPMHPLMKCSTIIEALYARCDIYPMDEPCIGYREILEEEIQLDNCGNPIRIDGKVLRKYKLSPYKWITYADFIEQMESTSRGMMAIGLNKYDPIAIYSETGLDFMISQTACAKCGALIVSVFHTLTDKGLTHAINETKCKFIFVSFELLDRVQGFIRECPTIQGVIYFEGPLNKKPAIGNFLPNIKVYTLAEIMDLGRSESYKHQETEGLKPDDLFGVMYTSGTTGIPKGVTITQEILKEAAMAIGLVVRDFILTGPEHTYIAYLPQAHILEMSLELFLFLGGVKIGYATPFTLNESAPGLAKGQICDLQLLKPTIMTTVPLVLDRMQKEIYSKLERRTPFSKAIFDYFIDYKAHWRGKGYQTPFVNKIVCSKVQEQFGSRLQYMVVGSAPLAAELQRMISCALNITMVQGYGSTETSGAIVAMDLNDLSFGRTGCPLKGVRVRMIDWPDGGYMIKDRPHPRGELIIGGKMISKGYLNLEQHNKEVFFEEDGNRWFITGDIGEMYPDGTLKIIDRKKDIVKLANGEFISLGKIEAILKSSSFVDNVCVLANSELNCLIGLVVPNQTNIDLIIGRLNQTDSDTKIAVNGSVCDKSNFLERNDIQQTVHDNMINVGLQQGLKRIELPCLITLCSEIWSPDNDLLTAAMKLKRANIAKFYRSTINQMWATLRADPSKTKIKTPTK